MFERFLKRKSAVTSLPKTITFEYARTNSEVQVMLRERRTEQLKPIEVAEPFVGFKAKTISEVHSIYNGPGMEDISSKNVTDYIEEPLIPTFLTLRNLGIQTHWSSANGRDTGKYRNAVISIVPKTLSEENLAIAKNLNLEYGFQGLDLELPIQLSDSVQEVSDKFLKLCSHFVAQPVLYGQKSQTEYLNAYSQYNNEYIAEISNIDTNYVSDHLKYLLTTFPQYVSFENEMYSCANMPDELFQNEVLNRVLSNRIFHPEPPVCINGIVWACRELYDINEHNKKQNPDTITNNSIKSNAHNGSEQNIVDVDNSPSNNEEPAYPTRKR